EDVDVVGVGGGRSGSGQGGSTEAEGKNREKLHFDELKKRSKLEDWRRCLTGEVRKGKIRGSQASIYTLSSIIATFKAVSPDFESSPYQRALPATEIASLVALGNRQGVIPSNNRAWCSSGRVRSGFFSIVFLVLKVLA